MSQMSTIELYNNVNLYINNAHGLAVVLVVDSI